jgi:hypothetical protein
MRLGIARVSRDGNMQNFLHRPLSRLGQLCQKDVCDALSRGEP